MDMAQDPLVRREPVSASCNRRPEEDLEIQKYSLYPKEHPTNCPLRWRLSNGLGVYLSWLQAEFSHHTRQPNWWSVHQRRLATRCCTPFRKPPTSYKACAYGWQHQASSFKSRNRISPKRNRDFCSLTSHEPGLNPIEHIWDRLGRRIRAREPLVQTIRQLEAALHREWQQLSQQDIPRLTGGMRRRVEAIIQARGVTPGTELWIIDVVKWFISDVLKVKCQSYRALWTVKVNT
jgi:hypothetical protein